jgi:murein DD-endopeptidase MepM/ murein hydrolase activator NlpD
MTGIKLEDLSYGALNEIADLKQSQLTGDPRRTSTSTSLQRGTAQAYEPNTLKNRSEFNGFVVASRAVTHPVYQNKASMFREYLFGGSDNESAQQGHTAYKVYIPELEPRPAPKGITDPILRTYPDVYSELSTSEVIPLNSLVLVRYENPATLSNPKIVKVLSKVGGVEGLGDNGGLAGGFSSGGPPRSLENTGPGGNYGSIPGPGTDHSCLSYSKPKKKAGSTGVTLVKGSDYQLGTQLHQNDWRKRDYNAPEFKNTKSDFILPVRPGEGKNSREGVPALRVSSGYNRTSTGKLHGGLDISAKTGTPLYAVEDGEVIHSPASICKRDGKPNGAGNTIQIKTTSGYYVRYVHLDMPSTLRKGATVKKGQLIGYVGDTGMSEAAHLHFDVSDHFIEYQGHPRLHPADFYPTEWLAYYDGSHPAETHRASIPKVHPPWGENKATA